MAKGKICELVVNMKNGYCCQAIKMPSIASAYRLGRSCYGFAFRIFIDGRVVKRGFCNPTE